MYEHKSHLDCVLLFVLLHHVLLIFLLAEDCNCYISFCTWSMPYKAAIPYFHMDVLWFVVSYEHYVTFFLLWNNTLKCVTRVVNLIKIHSEVCHATITHYVNKWIQLYLSTLEIEYEFASDCICVHTWLALYFIKTNMVTLNYEKQKCGIMRLFSFFSDFKLNVKVTSPCFAKKNTGCHWLYSFHVLVGKALYFIFETIKV